MNKLYRRFIKWIYKRSETWQVKAGLVIVLVLAGTGSVTNLGPVSSILLPSNPLADYQAPIDFQSINSFTASDGSGLDDLTTDGAEAGAIVTWTWTQGTEDVKLMHELRTGSPTQSQPHIIVPDDNPTSGLYWGMIGPPQTVEGTYLIQDISSGNSSDFYKVGVDSSEGSVTLGVGQTAITLSD